MKRKLGKVLMVIAFAVIVGFGVNAFAHREKGYGHHGWSHHGPGWHHRGFYGPNYMGRLSDEEIEKLDKERRAFFEATENLRQNIYEKKLELRSELAKKNPDAKKAARIQKEISKIEARLDQKRIDHMIKMRKINPNLGMGFMGPGMMGPGGYGGSYWPNCRRYMGSCGGYGMGQGMMGYSMGPSMMGHGYSQQYREGRGPLKEEDIKSILENYLKSTRNPNLELGKIKDVGDAFEVEIVTKEKSLVDKILVDKFSGWMRSIY